MRLSLGCSIIDAHLTELYITPILSIDEIVFSIWLQMTSEIAKIDNFFHRKPSRVCKIL
jgi:hypothetical protein